MDVAEMFKSVEFSLSSTTSQLVLLSIIILAIIPLVITRRQSRILKLGSEDISSELNSLDTETNESIERYNYQFDAVVRHVKGNLLASKKMPIDALESYFQAGHLYLEAKEFHDVLEINELILNNITKLKSLQFQEMIETDGRFSKYLFALEGNNEDHLFDDTIAELRLVHTLQANTMAIQA